MDESVKVAAVQGEMKKKPHKQQEAASGRAWLQFLSAQLVLFLA